MAAEAGDPAAAAQPVMAQPKAEATDSGEEILTVKVVSVAGTAEVRDNADQSWRAVQAGDTYQEGAEIRTGFGGQVQLASSVLSPQSSMPSHAQWAGMQLPLPQVNWPPSHTPGMPPGGPPGKVRSAGSPVRQT